MRVKTYVPYKAYPHSEEATELSRAWAKASYPSFLILAGIGIVIYDVLGALIAIGVWFIIRAWIKKTIEKIAMEDAKALVAKELERMIRENQK